MLTREIKSGNKVNLWINKKKKKREKKKGGKTKKKLTFPLCFTVNENYTNEY